VEIPLAAERSTEAGLRVMGRGSRKQPDRCRGTFVHELQNGGETSAFSPQVFRAG